MDWQTISLDRKLYIAVQEIVSQPREIDFKFTLQELVYILLYPDQNNSNIIVQEGQQNTKCGKR